VLKRFVTSLFLFYMFGVRKRRCLLSIHPLSVVVARPKKNRKHFVFFFYQNKKLDETKSNHESFFNGLEGVVCVPRRGGLERNQKQKSK
jgi:hypothetical protein